VLTFAPLLSRGAIARLEATDLLFDGLGLVRVRVRVGARVG
jgi:hypothetical protein